jgi:hypothetical protein
MKFIILIGVLIIFSSSIIAGQEVNESLPDGFPEENESLPDENELRWICALIMTETV